MAKILTKSLREQVYEYLKKEISSNNIKQGEFIDINKISEQLGVSKTPLRDALLQLEIDGFVKILPRRGIVVNSLILDDIKNIYEIIGALECSVLSSIADSFTDKHIQEMVKFNENMKKALQNDDFETYYENNLKFHNVYLDLSSNEPLKKMLDTLKQRLYDFPPNRQYVAEWEKNSTKEHDRIIELVRQGGFTDAGNFIKDVHWSFEVQRKYIELYYFKD
jgi:DNA-binding GntR family transcriptional regulator